MTKDEIMAMEPGRELDALVEYNIMRPWARHENYEHWKENTQIPIPNYSTDIRATWALREEIHNKIGATRIIGLCDDLPEMCEIWNGQIHIRAQALTTPEAICKAALLAVKEAQG
ncbi:BC1872 family protein [Desulfitobacterium hafniense]|uniref:BC1872 family protein n=1 Tax=Desulfitobacterium hafniense TaxID=49338 RepID=UPI00059D09A1|nr:hypothetical protein [Desulfitobacterium hafniense]